MIKISRSADKIFLPFLLLIFISLFAKASDLTCKDFYLNGELLSYEPTAEAVLGEPWEEFKAGTFLRRKYPKDSLPASELVELADWDLWHSTERTGREVGSWEVYDSNRILLASSIFISNSGKFISGDMRAEAYKSVIRKLSENKVTYRQITTIRFTHTHPSCESDCFSVGDIRNATVWKKFFEGQKTLRHVNHELAILYGERSFTGKVKLRKRAYTLPGNL